MLKRIDPFYWYMALVLRRFSGAALHEADIGFVQENLQKHRLVQWINLCGALLVGVTLRQVSREDLGTVVTALLGPVMVLGGAWFSMSFGAVPVRLISCSMEITLWMFASFKLAFTTMILAIASVCPHSLWPVLIVIYLGVDFSCIQYDTADGLKAGLDEAILRHSRAALLFYERQGISPEAPPDQNP